MATEGTKKSAFWRLGIIGWPLGYSLSPLMHEAALKATGLEGEYKEYRLEPGPDDYSTYQRIANWLDGVRDKRELQGFNVTMPYKSLVASWCMAKGNFIDELGKWMDAVNTVVVREGSAYGYNTDGEGFLQPLEEHQIQLAGQHIVILGAGGAGRAIAVTLARKTAAARLTIWNRHRERAQRAAERVNLIRSGFAEWVEDLKSLPIQECRLLVNATPMGMSASDKLPFDIQQLGSQAVAYDIVYEPRETPLIRAAKARGCRTITGDEMLAAQASASFEIWTGVKGMLPVMKKTLDEHFARAGRS